MCQINYLVSIPYRQTIIMLKIVSEKGNWSSFNSLQVDYNPGIVKNSIQAMLYVSIPYRQTIIPYQRSTQRKTTKGFNSLQVDYNRFCSLLYFTISSKGFNSLQVDYNQGNSLSTKKMLQIVSIPYRQTIIALLTFPSLHTDIVSIPYRQTIIPQPLPCLHQI